MAERVAAVETNEVLKIFTQALSEAYAINRNGADAKVREAVERFLKSMEDQATKFFRDNVDRREKVRSKSVFEDMLGFYKRSIPGY